MDELKGLMDRWGDILELNEIEIMIKGVIILLTSMNDKINLFHTLHSEKLWSNE